MFNLFFEDDFYSYVKEIYAEIEEFFSKNQNEKFFTINKEDVCDELFKKYSISFLEVDEKLKLLSKDKVHYTTDIFGREIKKPIYTFGVKFSGDKTLFRIKPSRFNTHVFGAYFSNFKNNELLCFDINYYDNSSFEDELNRKRNYLFFMADNVNEDIKKYNLEIKQKIFSLYESYESNLHNETDLLDKLGVEIDEENSKELFSGYDNAKNEIGDLPKNISQTSEDRIFQSTSNTNNEIIRNPFQAYDGNEDYIFVSYAHKDSKLVFQEIKKFHDKGYYIWYDQGITAGKEWDDEVANALKSSSLVVAFISKNAMASENVKNEIKFALEKNIPLVPIFLEKTQLTSGLELRLISKDHIFKYSLSEEDYLIKCFNAFEKLDLAKNENIIQSNGCDDSNDNVILPGCNEKESLIFKKLCEYCLDKSFDVEIDPMAILDMVNKHYDEKNPEKLADKIRYSLENLEKNNYIISKDSSLGMGFSTSSITFQGFCFYIKNIVKDKNIYTNVIRAIFVDELSTIEEISRIYNILPSIVDMFVKLFRKEKYIVCNNDLTEITVTPAGEEYFKRIINQQS